MHNQPRGALPFREIARQTASSWLSLPGTRGGPQRCHQIAPNHAQNTAMTSPIAQTSWMFAIDDMVKNFAELPSAVNIAA
ncbi:hypothetical protein [Mycolicibacterium sp. CBMA 226]|uniref:hypothetical protein n=1 Tax=Mycolicibacterium sp. CBMA 226 TaxID=2606611 RepID=UPI0012DE86BE|nr:hypothetical protein [Mycolicibacterium sp. CBMA 226]MUL76157.1 hypothetical protein [Mycolicibacterium sp. CBMA 226]